MLPKSETACFLIADISGYTSFLAEVELEHAQDIIADLMDTVVRSLRPPFRLAKFEGDAAFVYALADRIDGSSLQDVIDAAYFGFRKRLRSIRQATSCGCSACRDMEKLDLKLVGHFGAFVRQKMGGREELAGRDVILVHRLLKNGAGERLGGHAYALLSDRCVEATGIRPDEQGLMELVERVDVIGDVRCWVRDLELAWHADASAARTLVARDKAMSVITLDIAAPRQTVWDYFTMPGRRPLWRGADAVREDVAGGRRGVGTTNHCMHGDHAIVEEILDWRPFDYLTLNTLLPVPDAPKILLTYVFEETGEGATRVEIRIGRPKPKDKAFVEHAEAVFRKTIGEEFGTLKGLLEQAMDDHASTGRRRPT
jgi:uncharacterized protein YndB with AHSA1/START domain